ncbi:MAG: hypothetical protein A2622_09245 [Bdellovibrionales bacterium RIFCSPHIGHO2_01_FULL_40_29]|nr:MAG: hypothetical protein A2622_09245 [Bdellovibrionales bacterium RIFCSPHIGHO2_01_FULL_40_29]OFZ33590.1 MAG: hypothetical protein A3D17_00385 [Bdellovibrionales bacterium RIFCSPHIGHO2_02_FULL_40_15]
MKSSRHHRLFYLLICNLMIVIGCAKDEPPLVESQTYECQRTKLENQFIVHWKNKKPTLLNSPYENLKKFKIDHKNSIDFIEPNYRIAQKQNFISDFYSPPIRLQNRSAHDMIHTTAAWQAGFRGQGIVVAIIDTGINLNHPQLRNRLALNEIESQFGENGIDDDNNGFVDDIFGWNFVDSRADAIDEHGHGTAMAGVITGSSFNRPSLSMAPEAKILPVDFMNETGGTEFHARQAMEYAISRQVHIINNSWSINCSQLLKQAFINWNQENVIFVNASGNSPVDVVMNGIIPSSLNLPNNLNVGSLDEFGQRSSFSGFGDTVKIFAPGEYIPTIYPSSGWNHSVPTSGTSVSAAVVSGAAALLWSAYPQAKATEIIQIIIESADQEPSSQRVLDLRKAMALGNSRFNQHE